MNQFAKNAIIVLNDSGAWDRAVSAARLDFSTMSDELRERVGRVAAGIKGGKAALHGLTNSVEGELVCGQCGGECCNSGKYHFTMVDLLVYMIEAKTLFVPDFGNMRCPFLCRTGCMMEPEYRPFNCITFNCDRIEQLFPPSAVRKFYDLEKELRFLYTEMVKLIGNRVTYGLLSAYESNNADNGKMLFK